MKIKEYGISFQVSSRLNSVSHSVDFEELSGVNSFPKRILPGQELLLLIHGKEIVRISENSDSFFVKMPAINRNFQRYIKKSKNYSRSNRIEYIMRSLIKNIDIALVDTNTSEFATRALSESELVIARNTLVSEYNKSFGELLENT